jgi:hypothetical protein
MALVFHAFFVGFLTTNILSVYMRCPEALQIANLTSTNEELCPITLATRNWRIVMLCMMCLSAIIEISQLIPSPLKYLRCIENTTQLILLIGVLLINVPSLDHSNWQRDVAAVSICIAWTSLLIRLGQFPLFSLHVRMLTTVGPTVEKFKLDRTERV